VFCPVNSHNFSVPHKAAGKARSAGNVETLASDATPAWRIPGAL
jgi:hypothetical protein